MQNNGKIEFRTVMREYNLEYKLTRKGSVKFGYYLSINMESTLCIHGLSMESTHTWLEVEKATKLIIIDWGE